MNVAAFVNGGTSTSFELEVSVKIDEMSPADVTVVSFYDDSIADVDPDVADYDMDFRPLGASSRFDVGAYRHLRDFLTDYDFLHTHYNFAGSAVLNTTIKSDTIARFFGDFRKQKKQPFINSSVIPIPNYD